MAFTFKGSDAARARALAKNVKRPKFGLGEVVVDCYGDIGAVDAIYADMQAAEDASVIEDSNEWIKLQEKRPLTPRKGTWYSIVFGHGAGLAGERDIKKAPRGAKSQP